MKTYKFKYNKLVRDNIPELIKKDGAKVNQKILNEKNYLIELKKKLIEEVAEMVEVKKKEEILNELGDVQEIIDNLLMTLGYSAKDLKKVQIQKNKKNGSFKKRIYINYIKADDNFAWLEYHLKHQEKYPLIK